VISIIIFLHVGIIDPENLHWVAATSQLFVAGAVSGIVAVYKVSADVDGILEAVWDSEAMDMVGGQSASPASLRLPPWCCWLPMPWACSSPSRERERERERESITRQTIGDNSDYQRKSSWILGVLPSINRRRPSGGRRGCLERISNLHKLYSDFETTQKVLVS